MAFTSSSQSPEPAIDSEVAGNSCEVCQQPAHGKHFGAITCRACAAFFRRTKAGKNPFLVCMENGKCLPEESGKWVCKKCRLNKCLSLGMTPDNIQYNRDLFRSSETFNEEKRKRIVLQDRIPTTMERVLGQPHIVVYLKRDIPTSASVTFIDLTELLTRVSNILISEPYVDKSTLKMSTLEKLTFALKEARRSQKSELSEIKLLGKNESCVIWGNDITTVAKWLMNSDVFVGVSLELRLVLLKAIWTLWVKMERVAMTAEMRANKMCGRKQFVISHESVLDIENIKVDTSWHSHYTEDEMKYFVAPAEYYCNSLVDSLLVLQPTDIELTFIICTLCFQVTGKKLGGELKELTERLQQTIADDIHTYYSEKNGFPRYAHRLTRLLAVCNEYQRLMYQRQNRLEVATALNAYRIMFSHPEMFAFSY